MTRQEKQIVDDMSRFMNIMNDLFDVGSYILQEIDPQTGEHLQKQEQTEIGTTFRDYTLDELKQQGRRMARNILGYVKTIENFLTGTGMMNKTIQACTAMGIDFGAEKAEFNNMKTAATWVINNIDSINSKTDLKDSVANYIDANVPKLILIRRSWCLEGVNVSY